MKVRLIVLFTLGSLFPIALGAQQLPRTFGARAFSLDDGTGSLKTLQLDIISPLSRSYQLHLPPTPPSDELSYFAVDPSGTIHWESSTLPSLAAGNIWCGDSSGKAWSMPPGPIGAMLIVSNEEYGISMPEWSMSIPTEIQVPVNQLSSGTIDSGVTIIVGDGGSLISSGNGMIAANQLTGAGIGKYSGVIAIPQFASSLEVSYSGITNASVAVVSISDPNASEFTVIASVTTITPGVGFTVAFTAPYPNPAGNLNYTVINP